MRIIVLELTGKHDNIRLGHLRLLSLFLSKRALVWLQSMNCIPILTFARPFFACGVCGIGKGRRAKKGLA